MEQDGSVDDLHNETYAHRSIY